MMAPESKLPKTVGRYLIVRELGKGAMGRVLLAHDPVLERDVAIKHLRSDLPISPEQRGQLLERMRQEARACARVTHPNLVALHDMGETPDLGLYLVFEYVEGPNLKERLERGPLGAEAVATIARQVGDGLKLLHEAGVIHRDIKPENVILSRSGAKLTDFGIARVPDSTLTGAGNVLGTPAYSAPEAIRSSRFSPRSDQFSLAATLYEALSGRRAFPGDDAVFVATQIANSEPPKIAQVCGVSFTVDQALSRALSKQPEGRFEDCEQFGLTLAEALVPTARTTSPPHPTPAPAFVQPISTQPNRLRNAFWALAFAALGAWGAVRMMTEAQGEAQPKPALKPPAPIVIEEEVPAVAWLAERPKQMPKAGKEDDALDDEEGLEELGAGGAHTSGVKGLSAESASSAPPANGAAPSKPLRQRGHRVRAPGSH
ncbi:MAG TPA: serine/threonine-protein kinase [Polyangiaceae bacterium]|jgi:serine/threonine-protein kinase|nr:serine/threonine-protein kinase [Polyangiaceae bacterium]